MIILLNPKFNYIFAIERSLSASLEIVRIAEALTLLEELFFNLSKKPTASLPLSTGVMLIGLAIISIY
jgi:hypothetical protein